ncbi:MAG: peptidoglycan bridge formation glycyltransferase FemA/FemB family protein [Patescibacteria group bacterium]|jgi:lipid II:glycine glycyltransferase (peptidoglycan interpeptide bridge formation enzyme)
MELFYLEKAEQLDSFIKNISVRSELGVGAEFLQSWNWGEILKEEGEDILRVGVRRSPIDRGENSSDKNEGQLLAVTTLIKKSLLFGYSYWYAPRGPIIDYKLCPRPFEVENFLFLEIKKIEERALFLRIEPDKSFAVPRAVKEEKIQIDKKVFKIKKTLDGQPAQTLMLDLENGEEKLLSEMHQKTRYNLHLAEKKGVKTREGCTADLPEFWRLLNLTGERDNFRLHSLKHYQNLMRGEPGFIKLFLAAYEGRNIAAGLFSFYGDKVTYMHGASDNKFRNVMAPYLLQWSVIKMAISETYKYYDFYGIDKHKWPGVTRFKLGFGGRPVNYAGTYDVIFNPTAYGIYDFVRKLRRRFF